MTFLSKIKGMMRVRETPRGPRILVFGDSHTAALSQAQQVPGRTDLFDHIRVVRLRKEKGGRTVGDLTLDAFCREIAQLRAEDFVFSVVGGNQYAVLSTVQEPVDFDFLTSPHDQDIASDAAELVPYRAIVRNIDGGVRGSVGPVLQQMREATKAKLYHLAPPPPKADNDFILEHFEGLFEELGLQARGPTRPSLRLKCWEVQLQSLSKLCEELGVTLIGPPRKALDPPGFLAPRYYARDVTHANRRYGEMVLNQILRHTSTARRPGALAK